MQTCSQKYRTLCITHSIVSWQSLASQIRLSVSAIPSFRKRSEDVDIDESVELSLSRRMFLRGSAPSGILRPGAAFGCVGDRGGDDGEAVRERNVVGGVILEDMMSMRRFMIEQSVD